jgi:transposase
LSANDVPALDPFPGYANAIRDELPEAITAPDAFHVMKMGSAIPN